mmetsp:Transcript_13028/g.20680  ORF Transcript_13028/g.20680 Transcript_13028/m.20680 type:complete len:200 (-) Transcript_13028:601-1200(-)
MIGVMRPSGVATATEMSTFDCKTELCFLSSQVQLASGTLVSARAAALITKSFSDGGLLPWSLIPFRRARILLSEHVMVVIAWGTFCLDSVSRDAMTLRILVKGISVYPLPLVSDPDPDDAGTAADLTSGLTAWAWAWGCVGVASSDLDSGRILKFPLSRAFRTSPLRILPFGPLALTLVGSIRCLSIRIAAEGRAEPPP